MLARLFAQARSLWNGIRRTNDVDAEMEQEFRAHIEMRTADLVRSGVAPEEAARIARIEFGKTDHRRQEARQARGLGAFDEMRFSWLDIKLGARMLGKYPGLTFVGTLGMAVVIAIGAGFFAVTAAIFGGLPFDDGDRIVAIQNVDTRWREPERRIVHDFVAWRDELKSVEDLGAQRTVSRNLITAAGPGEPVPVAEISASAFRITRVPALLGRHLLDDDEREGAPPVVVIGYEAWRTHFDSDSAALGTQLRLGGVSHTLVGVMPKGYGFPVFHQYWTPLHIRPADFVRGQGPALFVFGRLAPGATLQSAQAELTAIGQRMTTDFPQTHERLRPRVIPYVNEFNASDEAMQFGLMQLFVVVLLLVVCTNVATLIYARTASRHSEIAVRTALGASRRRIVAHLFAESLVLCALAAAAGLAVVAYALGQTNSLVEEMGGNIPFWMRFDVSALTVGYMVVLTALGAVIVGVVPALKATGARVNLTLQRLSSGASGMQLGKTWTMLIVAQAAFAVAVLPVAVHYAREFVKISRSEPGFATKEFLIFTTRLDRPTPPSATADAYDSEFTARYGLVQGELKRRLEADPAVSDVIRLRGSPSRARRAQVDVEGLTGPSGDSTRTQIIVGTLRVDIKFFEALGVPVVAGRGFGPSDPGVIANAVWRDRDGDGIVEPYVGDPAAQPGAGERGRVIPPDAGGTETRVAIVNTSFVRQVLHGANAVGRRIRYPEKMEDGESAATMHWYEIVGVVEDFPAIPIDPDDPEGVIYHPITTGSLTEMLAVHVHGMSPAAFTGRLRTIATALDPELRLQNVRSMDAEMREAHRIMRLTAVGIFAVTASVLLLAAAGIYSMMSFTVERRRREIGIRIALGADRARVVRSIFARAFAQLGIGVVVGALLAPALLTFDSPMNGVKVLTLGGVSGAVLFVGLLASIGPTRRSLTIQPTEALKDS